MVKKKKTIGDRTAAIIKRKARIKMTGLKLTRRIGRMFKEE